MTLSVVIGVGVVIGVILLVSQLIDREKHAALRHLLMAVCLPLLLLIPATTMLEQDVCTPFQDTVTTNNTYNGTLLSQSVVSYTYSDYCVKMGNGSTVFMRVLATINFLYVFYILIRYAGDVLSWLKNIGRKI